jgi:hypothetical protein
VSIALALGTQRVEPVKLAGSSAQRTTLPALHTLAEARIPLVLIIPETATIPRTPPAPLILNTRRAIRVQTRALITIATIQAGRHSRPASRQTRRLIQWRLKRCRRRRRRLFIIRNHIALLAIVHQIQTLVERVDNGQRLAQQTLALTRAPHTLVLIVLAVQIGQRGAVQARAVLTAHALTRGGLFVDHFVSGGRGSRDKVLVVVLAPPRVPYTTRIHLTHVACCVLAAEEIVVAYRLAVLHQRRLSGLVSATG